MKTAKNSKNLSLILAIVITACSTGCISGNKNKAKETAVETRSNITVSKNANKKSPCEGKSITEITGMSELDSAINTNKFVIAKLTAKWCYACQMIKGIYEELSKKYCPEVGFFEVDVDRVPEIARRYPIRGVPSFLYFSSSRLIGITSGAMPKGKFEETISKLISGKLGTSA